MQHESVKYRPEIFPTAAGSAHQAAPLVFLALSWIVSGLAAASPYADTVLIKLILLIPPFFISVLLTLLNPQEGFTLWSVTIGFLVTQTGYQLAIGDLRLSALEVILTFLVLFLVWHNRGTRTARTHQIKLPGYAFLIAFIMYSFVMLAVSLLRGIPLLAILVEFKGFILYPLVPYIMVFGLKNIKIIRWSIVVVVAWYMYVSAQGIYQFLTNAHAGQWGGLFRASGDYASINTYGVTLLAMCLLVVGIALYAVDRRLKILLFMVAIWLFAGAVTSVARTVWIAGAAGVLTLLFIRGKRQYAIAMLLAGLIIFLVLPSEISSRIDQLSDSSTEKRAHYLEDGMQAWKARWLTGWGWGNSFEYVPGVGLVSLPDGIAWYHNDYLNLATQAGLIGLLLYLGYWLQAMRAAFHWQKLNRRLDLAGYVLGAQMALVGLLASAGFEHVLWKTDIAGVLGWVSGLMFTCMYLRDQDENLVAEA